GKDFAGGEDANLELAVRHLAAHLGKKLGAAVQRVERFGEARRQTPLHFRHALGNRRCRNRRRSGNSRGTDARGPDKLPTLHLAMSSLSDAPHGPRKRVHTGTRNCIWKATRRKKRPRKSGVSCRILQVIQTFLAPYMR